MSRLVSINIPVKLVLQSILPESKKNTYGTYKVSFEVLEIEPLPQMKKRIKAELLESGFYDQGKQLDKQYKQGHTAKLDLESMEMTVKVKLPSNISVAYEDEGAIDRYYNVQNNIDKKNFTEDAETKQFLASQIQKRCAPILEEAVSEASLEVNKAMKKAYKDALVKKAESMGKIKSVQESKKGNTFKVRVQVIEQ